MKAYLKKISDVLHAICLPQLVMILIVMILGVGSMLSGCGKKGSLYVPEKPASSQANN